MCRHLLVCVLSLTAVALPNAEVDGQVPTRYQPLQMKKGPRLVGVFGYPEIQPGTADMRVTTDGELRALYGTGGFDLALQQTGDSMLSYWDAGRGNVLRVIPIKDYAVTAIALHPDGKHAVAGLFKQDEKAKLSSAIAWLDLKAGTLTMLPLAIEQAPVFAGFSPDNKRAIIGAGNSVYIVDSTMKSKPRVIVAGDKTGGELVLDAWFLPDGKRAIINVLRQAPALWDLDKAVVLKKYDVPPEGILFSALSPDGKLLAGADHQVNIRVWNVETAKLLGTWNQAENHPVSLLSQTLSFNNNGTRLVSIAAGADPLTGMQPDSLLGCWDVANNKELWAEYGTWIGKVPCVIGKDSFTLGGGANSFERRSLETGKLQSRWGSHTSAIIALALDSKKQLHSASLDNTVRLWVKPGSSAKSVEVGTPGITGLALDPQGNFIVTGSADKSLKIWSRRDGKLLHTLTGHTDNITGLAVTPDGKKIVSGSYDRTVRVWDAVTGKLLNTFTGHSEKVNDVAIAPDGQWAVSASDDECIRFWSLTRKLLPFENIDIPAHNRQVTCVAFSPDGKYLATGSQDKTIGIWDVAKKRKILDLKGHTNWITGLAFRDNDQLVSTSDDLTVRIWNTRTSKQIAAIDLGEVSDAPKCIAVTDNTLYVGTAACVTLAFDLAQ